MSERDTIAALATPPGVGGVGVVRISGPAAVEIGARLISSLPAPRMASFRVFRDAAGEAIDEGLVLYFPGPASFTGEDVLEFQGHGGPVVMDRLLAAVLAAGARLAHPGEFSRRAFLNGKLDLLQAEAIADLISAGTEQAARLALRSLEGAFSRRIRELVDGLIRLRTQVEAAIDFPEEEIDFLGDGQLERQTLALLDNLAQIQSSARTGRLLRSGIQLVIAGPPNVGKSSLLNALAGHEAAIVSDIPGTTRDLVRERIQIDGIPVHVLDTAGLRVTEDRIEREGVRRALAQIEQADLLLWLSDARAASDESSFELPPSLPKGLPSLQVRNKIDLIGESPRLESDPRPCVWISAREELGLDLLRVEIRRLAGAGEAGEGEFLARRRHLDALTRAEAQVRAGLEQLRHSASGELLAEELRLAQQTLGEITGEFTADDLLGEIFSSFCIGK